MKIIKRNGVETDFTKEKITTAISKAISPSMLVNTWYYRETGSNLRASQKNTVSPGSST